MKLKYVEKNFSSETRDLIDVLNRIVEEYIDQGYRLTVRQLYYQLVAKDIVPNTEKSYKRITSVVNDAKLAGLIDWDAIEDRTREFLRRSRWNSPSEILKTAADSYHMDLWEGQATRVFVVVEKEALVGVLDRVCRKYDVPLLAARGYPSGTVLHEFCENDISGALATGQAAHILHCGDHDPSGIDMTRDLQERIDLFSRKHGTEVVLERIALTMDQIKGQRLPPNPAKSTDARFRSYINKYGKESWELDALPPRYLESLLSGRISGFIDSEKWSLRKKQIEFFRDRIADVAANFENCQPK